MKQTRRAKLLAEMDQVVPWRELCAIIEPYYPKAGNGRPPIGLERIMRLHFLQHWFNLSDPAAEESLYDSLSIRCFVGIDLGREPVPNETSILNFRRLLEARAGKVVRSNTFCKRLRLPAASPRSCGNCEHRCL